MQKQTKAPAATQAPAQAVATPAAAATQAPPHYGPARVAVHANVRLGQAKAQAAGATYVAAHKLPAKVAATPYAVLTAHGAALALAHNANPQRQGTNAAMLAYAFAQAWAAASGQPISAIKAGATVGLLALANAPLGASNVAGWAWGSYAQGGTKPPKKTSPCLWALAATLPAA